MGRGRRHHGYRRAHDVLQSRSSGAVHPRRVVVVRADVAGRGQAPRLHRHLRYHGLAVQDLHRLDGSQRRQRRAPHHHHAALLPQPSRPRGQLEHLHRAAGEVEDLLRLLGLTVRDAPRYGAPHHEELRPHPEERAIARVWKDEATALYHVPSSLNFPATSSVMASMADCASGPIAETTIDVPGPADSIISPMIEVPPTVSPPLVTQTSALKRSTI